MPDDRSESEGPRREVPAFRWMRRAFPGAFAGSAYWLAERARGCASQEGEKLFRRAHERFEALHRVNPSYAPGLKLWAAALTNRAPTLRLAEAERLNAEAEEKLYLALSLAPQDVDILSRLALVTARRAWLKSAEVALPLLTRAQELALTALSLKPHDPQALDAWALALYQEVHTAPGADIDRKLVDAFEKCRSAYNSTSMGQVLNAWGTVIFAQADRASGSEAERLLLNAKEKYSEVVARQIPGGGAYNLACVCARLGQFDECRQWLVKSGEPGRYVIREEMAADPELAAVRSFAWFQSFFPE